MTLKVHEGLSSKHASLKFFAQHETTLLSDLNDRKEYVTIR